MESTAKNRAELHEKETHEAAARGDWPAARAAADLAAAAQEEAEEEAKEEARARARSAEKNARLERHKRRLGEGAKERAKNPTFRGLYNSLKTRYNKYTKNAKNKKNAHSKLVAARRELYKQLNRVQNDGIKRERGNNNNNNEGNNQGGGTRRRRRA